MPWQKSSTESGPSKPSQTPGSVAGRTPRLAKPVIPEGTYVPDVDPFSTSTIATGTARRGTELSETSKPAIESVPSTSPTGQRSTVWTLSPLEFIDNQPDFGDEDLEELDPVTLRKLKQMQEGLGYPMGTVILVILEFLTDGGMFNGEMNVGEAVKFYTTNHWPEY